jgi:hypothetical protein
MIAMALFFGMRANKKTRATVTALMTPAKM